MNNYQHWRVRLFDLDIMSTDSFGSRKMGGIPRQRNRPLIQTTLHSSLFSLSIKSILKKLNTKGVILMILFFSEVRKQFLLTECFDQRKSRLWRVDTFMLPTSYLKVLQVCLRDSSSTGVIVPHVSHSPSDPGEEVALTGKERVTRETQEQW